MLAHCVPPPGFEAVEEGEVSPSGQRAWRAETEHAVLHVSRGGGSGRHGRLRNGNRERKAAGRDTSLHLASHHPREGTRRGRGYRAHDHLPRPPRASRLPFQIPSSGSPILLSRATLPSAASADPSQLPAIARGIRTTIAKFDSSAVGAVLRDLAFDTAAGKVWNAVLGQRDLIVMSWVRAGRYDVSDGGEVVMPGGW